MLNQASIARLYANVLHNDIVVNAVPEAQIRAGVQCMANVYMKNADFESSVLEFPNYNDVACRCAYLHKYAPLHTYIVLNVMMRILQKELNRFRELLVNTKCFKFCSLGGGPGSDVIGVFCALKFVTSSFNSSVTIIDCMEKWGVTFKSVLQELKFGDYGAEWHNLAKNFDWNYIGANLLCTMTDEVNKSIASATFITMVKFVSASTCTNTEEMVGKIFRVMKPGALVLYIDNAAGGFTQIIERAGKRNGLAVIYGPERHVEFEVEALKIERFGYTSCFKTKVTIILLQKTLNNQQSRRNLNNYPNKHDQNAPVAKSPDSLDFVVLSDNSSKNKMVNTINPAHPPKSINQTFSVAKPKNPVSTPAVEQNRIGIGKSTSNSLRPPERTASNINDLSAKLANTSRGLQKPNEAVGQMTWNVTTTKPRSLSSDVNSSRAPQPNTSQRSIHNNFAASSQPRRPTVSAVSTKSPTRSAPTSDRRSWSQSAPSSAARPYQPVPQNSREHDRSLRESNENSEEICCSCCTIS